MAGMNRVPPKHRARKRFGQNFLRDPAVIDRITTEIAPRPGEHLVEIGPGQGALQAPTLGNEPQLTGCASSLDITLSSGWPSKCRCNSLKLCATPPS